MQKTEVGIRELKTHLSALLRRVQLRPVVEHHEVLDQLGML